MKARALLNVRLLKKPALQGTSQYSTRKSSWFGLVSGQINAEVFGV